jgi:hypothetical protein
MTQPIPQMSRLLITSRGRSSLQRLDGYLHEKALKLMRHLASGTRHDCLKLELHENVYRSKLPPVRLIWFFDREHRIVVDRASQRKNAYQNYNGPNDSDASPVALDVDDDGEIDGQDTAERIERLEADQWPAHEVPEELLLPEGDLSTQWWQYLLGTFHRHPRLTLSQVEEFSRIVRQSGKLPVLLQASPGTGKSVCALHYAIRLHREKGFSVYYGAPADLVRDLREAIPSTSEDHDGAFKLDEVANLLAEFAPGPPVASADESADALQQCGKHLGGRLGNETLTSRDVQLYEAFVADVGNQKDVLFKSSEERLSLLQKIKVDKWQQAVRRKNRRTRTEVARAIAHAPPPQIVSASRILLIADESQDLLLDEIAALGALWKRWRQDGSEVHLWLLGDLNQRISPTNFSWTEARRRLDVPELEKATLDTNYRNTAEILR